MEGKKEIIYLKKAKATTRLQQKIKRTVRNIVSQHGQHNMSLANEIEKKVSFYISQNQEPNIKPEASIRFVAIHDYRARACMLGSMVKEIEPSDPLEQVPCYLENNGKTVPCQVLRFMNRQFAAPRNSNYQINYPLTYMS